MVNMELSALIAALNTECKETLESAAVSCVESGRYEVTLEDLLTACIKTQSMRDISAQFDLSQERLQSLLHASQGEGKKHTEQPVFSPLLVELLQEAYLFSSLELQIHTITIPILILTLLRNPVRYSSLLFFREIERIPQDKLRTLIIGLHSTSGPLTQSQSAPGDAGFLERFTTNLTRNAREGKTDPVFARDTELRQMMDILSRRRKNNPILVGEPGVGKTAVAEGLARRIVLGNVPKALQNVELLMLDMGLLQAGASVKGEFEKRLKGVIDAVKAAPVPTILFIDEAHTLVGAGSPAGAGDAANLLKPALARGELRTVAATTWSEYKKYFEKDAALARRFQPVRLDEPSIEEAITILRGLVGQYETSHQVYVRDDAVVHAVELATRYITGRLMPDKAIDLLDTACARISVSMSSTPRYLEDLEEKKAIATRELTALVRDINQNIIQEKDPKRKELLEEEIIGLEQDISIICEQWEKEKEIITKILEKRTVHHAIEAENALDKICGQDDEMPEKDSTDSAQTFDSPNKEIQEPLGSTDRGCASKDIACMENPHKHEIAALQEELCAVQKENPLVHFEVAPALVASVVSEWTGIPVDRMIAGQKTSIKDFIPSVQKRIKGQHHAVATIEKSIRASQAGLNNPSTPGGIFLLVGPSGVGKTETALAATELLYGEERFLININMSEFQERHTVSRLIGSPPGYVGYGEGGRLTEAVRQRPYSAVLFDEVEKAHPDVMNLFYQVFDKGVLADGEGREVDFKNTLIFLTSNLGSDIITSLCEEDNIPDETTLQEAIWPTLMQHFSPALLGRMTIVPYYPLNTEVMEELVELHLQRVSNRLMQRHGLTMTWEKPVVASIVASCSTVETGARNIEHIVKSSLLPAISERLLSSMLKPKDQAATRLILGLDVKAGTFTFSFS